MDHILHPLTIGDSVSELRSFRTYLSDPLCKVEGLYERTATLLYYFVFNVFPVLRDFSGAYMIWRTE